MVDKSVADGLEALAEASYSNAAPTERGTLAPGNDSSHARARAERGRWAPSGSSHELNGRVRVRLKASGRE